MKQSIFIFCLIFLSSNNIFGQLEPQDLSNLVKMGEAYASDQNARGEEFMQSIEALRTPALDHMADVFISIAKSDSTLLEPTVINRPSNEELKYWYVIREIHYQKGGDKSNTQIAEEVLAQEIDERWLVDNYYYRVQSGFAFLFNGADLSNYNLSLDDYGLKNDTEKAIVFLNIMDALIVRFRVLNQMGNPDGLLAFASKLPKVNAKPYFKFVNFDFDDFDFIGHKKLESYKETKMSSYYAALISHFMATVDKKKQDAAQAIYFNSILSKKEYFKYSADKKTLKTYYKQSK